MGEIVEWKFFHLDIINNRPGRAFRAPFNQLEKGCGIAGGFKGYRTIAFVSYPAGHPECNGFILGRLPVKYSLHFSRNPDPDCFHLQRLYSKYKDRAGNNSVSELNGIDDRLKVQLVGFVKKTHRLAVHVQHPDHFPVPDYGNNDFGP